MSTWSVVTVAPRNLYGLSFRDARPGAEVIDWVPKMKSLTGGSATDRPIVVTSLMRVDFPRTKRNSTAYSTTPSSGASTRIEMRPALMVDMWCCELSQ